MAEKLLMSGTCRMSYVGKPTQLVDSRGIPLKTGDLVFCSSYDNLDLKYLAGVEFVVGHNFSDSGSLEGVKAYIMGLFNAHRVDVVGVHQEHHHWSVIKIKDSAAVVNEERWGSVRLVEPNSRKGGVSIEPLILKLRNQHLCEIGTPTGFTSINNVAVNFGDIVALSPINESNVKEVYPVLPSQLYFVGQAKGVQSHISSNGDLLFVPTHLYSFITHEDDPHNPEVVLQLGSQRYRLYVVKQWVNLVRNERCGLIHAGEPGR